MEMLEANWKWYKALELTDIDLWYLRSGDWLKVATEEIVKFVTAIEKNLVLTGGEIFSVICPLNRVLQKKRFGIVYQRTLVNGMTTQHKNVDRSWQTEWETWAKAGSC